ncbi:MAG: hemerythrin family protein [Leptospiraceae bacterium]|nr:hemerythrin family protein [Leptospiraceae bacterium]MCP5496942.1 hemerythrin family protein [Leptospiraceae bacterium]
MSKTRYFKVKEIWDKTKIQLDIPIIDLYHMWILSGFVHVEELVELEFAQSMLNKHLTETLECARVCFQLEEIAFEKYKYPQAEEHIDEHARYLNQVEHLFNEFSNPESGLLKSLLYAAHQMMLEHIEESDKKFTSFLLKKKVDLEECNEELLLDTNISKSQAKLYNTITDSVVFYEGMERGIIENVIDMWRSLDLSIHIPIIDMQHLWLLRLLVELESACRSMNSRKKKMAFQNTMLRSFEYTREHFFIEELLMRKFNYPDLHNHGNEHKRFVTMLNNRNQEFRQKKISAAPNLVQDLKNWLLTHIGVNDKKLRGFFAGKMKGVNEFIKDIYSKEILKIHSGQFELYKKVMSSSTNGKK